MAQSERPAPRIVVFAPSPLLTVTIECKGDAPDVHLHAGGQGFWLARMIAALGVPVTLCGSFGGETGVVVRTLIEQEGVAVRGIDAEAENAAYVHDRRDGKRMPVAEMAPAPLSRHEIDELYAVTLVESLEADVCVLGGPSGPDLLPSDTYRRLAADLMRGNKTVVADLSGKPLREALEGGVVALKVSDEELRAEGVTTDRIEDLVTTMRSLRAAGAEHVVVSRGDQPALAMADGNDRVVEVISPRLEPVDVRGAGDAMTAGLATALARGESWEAALRLGAAAGSLNVARRGLGTGRRQEIERLAAYVQLRPLDVAAHKEPVATATPEDLAALVKPS
jgi:1-phosphofructokinase